MEIDNKKLISAVHENTPLWDTRDHLYHSRDVQRKLWVKVADEVGANVTKVKKKWKGLRDIFRREYRKILKSEDDAPKEINTSWAYFNHMKFLSDIVVPRPLKGNIKSPQKKSSKEINVGDNSKMEDVHVTLEFNNSAGALQNIVSGESPECKLAVKQSKKKKSDKKKNFDDGFLEIQKANLEMFVEKQPLSRVSDYQFLVSLLPFLYKVAPHRKLVVRNKLQQVFMDEDDSQQFMPEHYISPSTWTVESRMTSDRESSQERSSNPISQS